MEQTCTPSADIDSTGCCHSNIKSTTATATSTQIAADTPERTSTITASYLRSSSPPQMSSKEQQLLLQTHNNHGSDKKLFANSLSKHAADEGRSCSISMSTPAADNIALFKDDDSRSGSSDDITTPIVDLHHLHQRHHNHHHRHHKQLNGNNDDDLTPATSTNTIEVIQDHRRRCQELDSAGGVAGVGIYLETPVIDEQIVGLNSHDYEKAKPKRLSDEFLLSSEEFCDDERNSSSDSNPLITHISNKSAENNVSNSNSSEILKNSGILNDMLRSDDDGASGDGGGGGECMIGYCESQYVNGNADVDASAATAAATASGSMSSRFKNISIDYHPYDKVKNGSIDGCATTTTDVTENDVQSMDAIERRDFEHEQRLTGGIILKSSSLAQNDRLKLELVQQSMQNANNQQRAVSSDSKCTYKDHSTTPTSSRHCSSRLTKSTAKINLTTSLINHPEITAIVGSMPLENSDSQDQDDLDTGLLCIHHQTVHHHHHHQPDQPGSSKSALEALSSVASTSASASVSKRSPSVDEGASKNIFELIMNINSNDSLVSERASASASKGSPSVDKDASKNIFELIMNINSNDSLASEHSYSTSSSHSLSHLTKPQQPGCSGASATSSLKPEEEVHKKAVVQAESNHSTLQQKLDGVNEDEVASTSSSARCQYPALKYIRNSQRKDSTSALNGDEPAAQPAEERVSAPITLSSILAMNSNSHSNVQHLQQQLSHDVATIADLPPHLESELHENEFDDETWVGGEEGSDEEQCTCYKDNYPSKRDASDLLSEDALSKDVELSSYIQMVSISEDTLSHEPSMSPEFTGLQRKRKFNESRLLDSETLLSDSGRKRIAYDYASTPRSSQTISVLTLASPSTPLGRRSTPRSMMHTRQNPPPELHDWLVQFQLWTQSERIIALDRLIEHCEPTQVRYMMKVIEPQFQRDFISLLPRELALQVLAYLDPKDLLRAAQTCRSWRFLCDDNLLWKEKCRKAQILTEPKTDRPKRGRAGNMPPIASPWKAAYMRQHIIEMNWRSRPIREPKVLKGHDDHVITCLQFSGNRIVSGSDDNTLKVWSAVTGRCLRTLVGHTGGVWSSQMSGNIIISGSTDRTLKVWDMETGQCVHTLLGHTSTVRCMHLHGKKVVSGSRDATLRVWDIERGTCLHVLVGHLAAVRCVQYDGKLIVSGAYDYMVKIWHPERQECLHTLQGHTNRVYSLQFDGIHVVSGSLDTSIRVWDVETGNCKHTLMGHQSLTSGMELRQNILVSGNADSTVKVWDITSGQCLQTLSGPNKHQSAVTCLQFNSRFVITSSDDGTVKLWDVKTGEFIRNLVALDSGGSGGVVWRIRANDTKLICAVGSRNGTEETKLMVLDFDVEGACVKCS